MTVGRPLISLRVGLFVRFARVITFPTGGVFRYFAFAGLSRVYSSPRASSLLRTDTIRHGRIIVTCKNYRPNAIDRGQADHSICRIPRTANKSYAHFTVTNRIPRVRSFSYRSPFSPRQERADQVRKVIGSVSASFLRFIFQK